MDVSSPFTELEQLHLMIAREMRTRLPPQQSVCHLVVEKRQVVDRVLACCHCVRWQRRTAMFSRPRAQACSTKRTHVTRIELSRFEKCADMKCTEKSYQSLRSTTTPRCADIEIVVSSAAAKRTFVTRIRLSRAQTPCGWLSPYGWLVMGSLPGPLRDLIVRKIRRS